MADLKRFFKKTVSEDRHKQAASVSVPEGLWIKCPKCGEMVYREDVISNAYVCPKCGGYFRISAKRRIKMIADKGSFKEWFTGIDNSNPLDYPDYPQKIEDLREKTHLDGNSHRRSHHRRNPYSDRSHGYQISHGFHGICGGRKDHPLI